MTIFNAKFNIDSLDNEGEKQAFLDLLSQHPSDRKNAHFDSQAVMKELIKAYAKQASQPARSGVSGKTSDRIKDAVQAQMDVNTHSTKYILVGTGDKQEKVFFEKRALTPKKIADLDGFNLKSVTNWLKQGNNAEWVDTHNREVLGLETDVLGGETSDAVKSFNLKTSRSHRTVNGIKGKVEGKPELVKQDG